MYLHPQRQVLRQNICDLITMPGNINEPSTATCMTERFYSRVEWVVDCIRCTWELLVYISANYSTVTLVYYRTFQKMMRWTHIWSHSVKDLMKELLVTFSVICCSLNAAWYVSIQCMCLCGNMFAGTQCCISLCLRELISNGCHTESNNKWEHLIQMSMLEENGLQKLSPGCNYACEAQLRGFAWPDLQCGC